MKKRTILQMCISILFIGFLAGCNMQPGAFTINFGNYDPFTEKVWVTVSNDNSNCNVRSAECYWTFDGSTPSSSQTQNTNKNEADKDFLMDIPSDFYDGNIKFLCTITYSMMGKKETVTTNITKHFKTKYHQASGNNLNLVKNKGFAKSYSIGTTPVHQTNTITYTVTENGTLTINIISGVGSLSLNNELITDGGVYSGAVSSGTTISIKYDNATYITSGASSIISAQYTIVLE